MPELPEVETTRCGLAPHLIGQNVQQVIIRQPKLRWPIPTKLNTLLAQQKIINVQRRAKYLLIQFNHGDLIIHLGMSGSLRVLPTDTVAEKHDHFDLVLNNHQLMRLRDPRRFGAILWQTKLEQHPLLQTLGPEPISLDSTPCLFNSDYLFQASRKRGTPIKHLIMDNHIVVGIGNIYANEALFRSGILPTTPAKQLKRQQCELLVNEIQSTLQQAIQQGGSTLRDFVHTDGKPGYFQQSYWVYGRSNAPCLRCEHPIQQIKQGQRSSFFCPQCQC